MKYKRNERELKGFRKPVNTVGLTGGIASGKTVATDALIAAGYSVIDADEVSRALTAKGTSCEKRLTEMFPQAKAPDGSLDRAALRALIGRDSGSKKKLDEYTHPLITAEITRLIKSTPPPVVLSAPLLYEAGLGALCDAVVCVTCARSTRIKRITARDGTKEEDAANIIDAQLPDEVRASLADFCVPSDGDKAEFQAEIVELFDALFCRSRA